MKRLLTALALAALIITAYILELNMLKSSVKPMISQVDGAIESLKSGDGSAAAEKISELNNMWDKSKDRLSLFIDHCEINEVDVLVSRLTDDDTDYYNSRRQIMAEYRELKMSLETIVENESPSLINVA